MVKLRFTWVLGLALLRGVVPSRVEPALLALSRLSSDHVRNTAAHDRGPTVESGSQTDKTSSGTVVDPSGSMPEKSLSGGWTPMSEWKTMWHPYLVLFWLHVAEAALATYLSLHHPKALLVIIAFTGLLWPLSWAANLNLWDEHHRPLTADWWMTFIKWLIVDALAGLPVISSKAFDTSERVTTIIGYGIYVILGSNIVWTMLYTVDGWVRMWNTLVGGVLVVSLAIHCVAVTIHGKPLLERHNGFPYGRGTTLAWLISYTVWNAMFVMDYSMGMTLQDLLFWGMMLLFQYWDDEPRTIDLYFAYARPVQLSVYIATGCWCGIIPFFAKAVPLAKHVPLHVNEHSYFLFINTANFCLACYTLGRSIWTYKNGPASLPAPKRLTVAGEAGVSMQAVQG